LDANSSDAVVVPSLLGRVMSMLITLDVLSATPMMKMKKKR
jgi:hypothetical protein